MELDSHKNLLYNAACPSRENTIILKSVSVLPKHDRYFVFQLQRDIYWKRTQNVQKTYAYTCPRPVSGRLGWNCIILISERNYYGGASI